MRIVLFVLMIVAAVSCKQSAEAEIETDIRVSNPGIAHVSDPDFIDFYQKFHSDSLFQMSRIDFPLKGLPIFFDPQTDDPNYFHQKEDWRMHKEVNYTKAGYVTQYLDRIIVVEERIIDDENYGMIRRFYKDVDGWKMIYFAAFNFMGKSAE